MLRKDSSPKTVRLELGGPVGPLPPKVVSIASQTIRIRDEDYGLVPGDTVVIRLDLGARTLFELFGSVAERDSKDASILIMASTPGFIPWLRRAAKMGYIELEEEAPSPGQMIPGLSWTRPSEPSPFKN